jgi:predicted ATPase/DNA-binding SARP family transcriptional activator
MELLLLGPPEVRTEAATQPVRRRQGALLALLGLEAGRVVSRDRLIDELWPRDPPESAAKALDVYVWRLRRAVPDLPIVKSGGGYRLDLPPDAVDALRFEALVERGRAALTGGDAPAAHELLSDALALWRGPALGGLGDLLTAEAARLEELRLVAQEDAMAAGLEAGRAAELVPELEALVAEHPIRERLRGLLMLALYRSGRQADALAVYQDGREALVEQLGIEPAPALKRLEQAILRQDPELELASSDGASHFLRVRPGAPRADLPAEVTSFVGRSRELGELDELLRDSGARVVTLTRAGGCGKTRLALRTAAGQIEALRGRVFFVPLAQVADPRLVVPTIADVLRVPETAGRALLDSIATNLASRETLLVLDNFEQVIDAAPDIAALSDSCPLLRVLLTSRVPTGIPGEVAIEVSPLDVPAEGASGADVLEYPSVQLFADRGRDIRHDFSVGESNGAAVGELCARLDGLPLAIELAAARVRLLTPEAMLARVSERLDLLATGEPDAPARHRTLRASIAWSHDLLEPGEREVFRRLAVFRGGCTLAAAEAVCKATLEDLTRLAEHNLLTTRFAADGEARFAMLETIREFALEQLRESGELDDVERRHAEFFARFAEEIEPYLNTGGRAPWQQRLADERDNLRAAIAWSIEHDVATPALRILAALWQWYWLSLSEGRDAALRVLALPSAAPPTSERAGTIFTAALTSWGLGDIESVTEMGEEAAAVAEQVGDDLRLARAIAFTAAQYHDEPEPGRAIIRKALETVARTGDGWHYAWIMMTGAIHGMYASDPEFAVECGEESVRRFRELEDDWSWAVPGVPLGMARLQLGNLDGAREILEECLPVLLDVRDYKMGNICVIGLALVGRFSGELEEAGRRYAQALSLCAEAGDLAHAPLCLEGMAAARVAEDPAEAAKLLGAARAINDAGHTPAIPGFEVFYAGTHEALSETLGDALETLLLEGRRLTHEGALIPSAYLELELAAGA